MAVITPDLVRRMEQHLLEDVAIKQAKIIDLTPNTAERDFVVAIALAFPSVDDQTVARVCRRGLIRKMRDAGGKAVVPRKWAQPGDLPLTATGLIDEEALRDTLLMDVSTPTEEFQPPTSDTIDEKILGAIASVLHVPQDQLVQTRSFTENGGDSMTAIQVFQTLMRQGISLRVPQIMRTETLVELAALVVSQHAGPSSAPAPAVTAPVSEILEVKAEPVMDNPNPTVVSVTAI